ASRAVLALAFVGCVLVYHLLYQGLARRARLYPIPDSEMAPLTSDRVPTSPPTQTTQTTQAEH
ncbi:hypothetical protein, partial [Hydrogenophaga sp.]|uniref:hypothetical protein n=1 Tax=Hydrogenophaga sp. TaxID=1904254 RepID=UPI00356ADB77